MPYTVILNFAQDGNGGAFPDVFDLAWEASTLVKAAALCGPVRNDPLLLSYFLDNEVRNRWCACVMSAAQDMGSRQVCTSCSGAFFSKASRIGATWVPSSARC